MPLDDDAIIITPGGPRPASLVHSVASGDVVEQTGPDTFNIRQSPSAITALHRKLLATGDYEITPGGIRHKSMIHTVQPGEIVAADQGVYKRFHVERQEFIKNHDTPAELAPDLPGLGSGWITYAAWTEPAANVITEITTTWTVPPAPQRADGQLVYLFNGLQDFPVTHILQPVLQWGHSSDGGGNSWALASWFVGQPADPVFKSSPLVSVQPGDTLTGIVKMLTNHNGNFFFCISEFVGISGTGLSVNSLTQLVMPVEVLECYTMVECRDYPDTVMTSMRAIDVRTASGSRPLLFQPGTASSECGQNTIVKSNTTGAGQVDLYYRTPFTAPAGSVIGSVSRTPNNIDLFAVASDGSVNSTFWTSDGGWLNRWFRLPDTAFSDSFTVPPPSEISVLSRFPQHLDLFTVGRNSAVYTTFWDGSSWSGHWMRLVDSTFGDGFTVSLQTHVSSLARTKDNIDLFVSGRDGAVYTTFWTPSPGWVNRWFRLADVNFGDHFTIPPGAPVTSVARTPGNIDLFVTGRDGAVYTTWWTAQAGWSGRWVRLADTNFGDHFTLPPGSPVSAISRGPGNLDLFVTGRDGAVYTTWWTAQAGWSGRWVRLADTNFGDHFTLPPGSPVTAITRAPQQIDLFASGKDGGVYTTAWSGSWTNRWIRLADPIHFGDAFTIPPGVRVDAQARQSDIIDLFVVGRDNAVYSTFWNAQHQWAGRWFRV